MFRRYLVHDYAFVTTLADLVGHAAGEAPTVAAKRELAGLLGTLTAEEDDYFERSFDALSVPPRERDSPAKTPTTEAFEDLLARAAHEGGYAESLSTLLAVEWIYCTWDVANADADLDRFYLAERVDLYAVPAFESFVGWLRAEFDRRDRRCPSPRLSWPEKNRGPKRGRLWGEGERAPAYVFRYRR